MNEFLLVHGGSHGAWCWETEEFDAGHAVMLSKAAELATLLAEGMRDCA